MFKTLAAALMATGFAFPALAGDNYTFDKSHTDIIVSWNHLGFSTSTGEFLDYDGSITLDEADPAKSSISVTFNLSGFDSDWEKRDAHFSSADFFDVANHPIATFNSTSVDPIDGTSAKVTGDLTIKGITKSVELDVKLNRMGDSPIAEGVYVAGFDATTIIKRSDFELGLYAPHVSDDVTVTISTELNRQ